jgi:hypothetical protein
MPATPTIAAFEIHAFLVSLLLLVTNLIRPPFAMNLVEKRFSKTS